MILIRILKKTNKHKEYIKQPTIAAFSSANISSCKSSDGDGLEIDTNNFNNDAIEQ